jgi:iron uptake system component EfeO
MPALSALRHGAGSALGHYSHLIAALGLVCAVAVSAVGAYLHSSATLSRGSSGTAITVSTSGCGEGWHDPRPGAQTFLLENSGSRPATVQLLDPRSGAVYGEVEGLGPGTNRPLQVVLGAGTYAFRCLIEDQDAIVGPSARLTGGSARGGPAIVPVTRNDLLGPLRQYRAYVATGLAELVRETDALKTAVVEGDLDGARATWLAAHLSYQRLGAAYGTFGDFDRRIDPRADDLPGGVDAPGFTGFHRLEYGLWHGQMAQTLAPSADRLDQDVRGLRGAWPDMEIDPNDLGRRAHEIMENALQLELTAETDYGSGASLATVGANLEGTREVLSLLRPLLLTRYPGLASVDSSMGRVQGLLGALQGPGGSWPAVASLTRGQREELNGAVGALLERLAPVAAICQPRRTS